MNPDLEREKSMNYYLSKRKRGKNSKWYVYFFDNQDTRKYTMSFSVEQLRRKMQIKDRTPLTREKEALVIVERAIEEGLIRRPGDEIPFIKYVQEFWDFDNSDYIRRRNQKTANSIGKDYALSMLGTFNKNALPHLSKKLLVSQVTAFDIERVSNELLDEGVLSNATIKRVLQSMAVPLREATRIKMVAHNPMDGVEPITSTPRKRGIFTIDEVTKIVIYLRDKSLEGTVPIDVYLAVALAALTGMRMGEVRALCSEQIKIVTDESAIITVDRAVNDYAGEKSTKGKRTRQVPAPRTLCEELLIMANQNPYEGDTRVFWSDKSTANPIADSHIRKYFYMAMREAGKKEQEIKSPIAGIVSSIMIEVGQEIEKKAPLLSIVSETSIDITASEECVVERLLVSEGHSIELGQSVMVVSTGGIYTANRIERNVGFHSLRHTFNSAMRGKINDKSLRAIVGHESIAMTDLYTHETEQEILVAGKVTRDIFSSLLEVNVKNGGNN